MREPTSSGGPEVVVPRPPATDGLGRLDQDRALSLADEGGVSAATVEGQDAWEDTWDPARAGRALALFALAALAVWSIQRAFRS
jgi:hypothetical protein